MKTDDEVILDLSLDVKAIELTYSFVLLDFSR